MVPGEALSDIFLQWKSLILALFILGSGYIGLSLQERWCGRNVIDMKTFDKVIRSILFGFLSFSIILTFLNITITNEEDILVQIGKEGFGLFILTTIVSIALGLLIYLLSLTYNPKRKKRNNKNKK